MRAFIEEPNFTAALQDTVLPYLNNRRQEARVPGHDKKPLYTAHYRADRPRGTVLLLHGFSENAEKYREFIYYLLNDGLSVLVLDQRGHGRSPRAVPPSLVHIDRFDEYIEDLEAVLTAFSDTVTAPFYLFAHSMGGAVAALYLEKHPNVFKKAILSAPMISLSYHGPLRAASFFACRFCTLTGRAKKAVFISHKDYANEPFETSSALSPARFAALRELRRSDPLLCGGTPTYAWSLAAFGVTKRILARGAPERVKIPVRIYAAERERLVSLEAQAKFAARLPAGELKTVLGSKHEILFANDEILHPVLEEMLDFLR